MKPAVLVLASTYPRWADDTEPGFVHQLCKRLTASYEIHVLSSHSDGALRYEELDGVHIHRFSYAPSALERLIYPGGMLSNLQLRPWLSLLLPVFLISQIVQARRLIKKHNIRIIHAHWVIPQGLVAYLLRPFVGKKKPPLLVTSHGADVYGLSAGIFRFFKVRIWREAKVITAVSHAMAEKIREQSAGKPVVLAPMGVELRTEFIVKTPLKCRRHLIFVGRLVEKKGVGTLLSAFALVIKKFPDIRLTIVGSGPYLAALLRQAHDLSIEPAIRFVGAVPNSEIPAWLNRHTIAVVPSVVAASGDQEGLGLVTIEAMGCACAVVASDLPAIRDVIDKEKTGLMFEPGDEADLARQLIRLLADDSLRQRVAIAGRAAALARFDWSRTAQTYREIYADLL